MQSTLSRNPLAAASLMALVALSMYMSTQSAYAQSDAQTGTLVLSPPLPTTITLHNQQAASLDDSATVTYLVGWTRSTLRFHGIGGVARTPAGPFRDLEIVFDRGDHFYLCTVTGEIMRVEVIQEVQGVVTLEFQREALRSPERGTSASGDNSSLMSQWLTCSESGRRDGRSISTGGSMFGGFAGGFFLGLIGTGIAYFAQSEPDPPSIARLSFDETECWYAYTDAYRRSGRDAKRNAALTGGIFGTATFVTLYLIAISGN